MKIEFCCRKMALSMFGQTHHIQAVLQTDGGERYKLCERYKLYSRVTDGEEKKCPFCGEPIQVEVKGEG